MASLISNDVLLRAPKNNKISYTSLVHLDKSISTKSFLHTTSNESVIIGSIVEAAVQMVKGNVSIAKVDDDNVYFECLTPSGNICAMIYSIGENTLKYEFDEDFNISNNVWPLAALTIWRILGETTAKELKDSMANMRKKLNAKLYINDYDAFIVSDYVTFRLASKKKSSLDIDMDNIKRVFGINLELVDGNPIELKEDLTMKYLGHEGVFEKITFASETNNTKVNIQCLGQRQFSLNEELSDEEKNLIPKISGVVERSEYVRTLQFFYARREQNIPNNIISVGPSGSGKSFLTSVMAMEFELPYLSFDCSEELSETTLKGSFAILPTGETVFKRSAFAKMVERPCVIEFAEATAAPPTILTMIYDLMDRQKMFLMLDDGTIIKRHPHCYFIFTFNTYNCMNNIALSLQRRGARTVRLPMMNREQIAQIIKVENAGTHIDDDILRNVLDCMEKIEAFIVTSAPRGCETSMSTYSNWAAAIQDSRNWGNYNPIEEARATILPMISSATNYSSDLEDEIINTIIAPTFNFFERGVI